MFTFQGKATEIIELEQRLLRQLAKAVHKYHLEITDPANKREVWELIEELNQQTSIIKLDPKEHIPSVLEKYTEPKGLHLPDEP